MTGKSIYSWIIRQGSLIIEALWTGWNWRKVSREDLLYNIEIWSGIRGKAKIKVTFFKYWEEQKFNLAIFLPVFVKYAVPGVWDVVRSRVEPPKKKDLWKEKRGQDWTLSPGGRRPPSPTGNCSSGSSGALPSAHSPGPCAYRGKFISQVGEHSFRWQKSWVFPQLVQITQKDEFITLTPGPGILQGFIYHPPCRVTPF